jgi:hypothetical protein
MSVNKAIQDKISQMPKGSVFSAHDFYAIDNNTSKGNIDIILHRLSKDKHIRKLGYGLYDVPIISSILGPLAPQINDIIDAYSRKLNQFFVLAPIGAAHILGITTQVPSKLVYLTDGRSHVMTICHIDIHFIHASPKNMIGGKTNAGLVFQSLRYLSPNDLSDDCLTLLSKRLSKSDVDLLYQQRVYAPKNVQQQIDRIKDFVTLH